MKILNRVFWVFLTLFSALYGIFFVGLYLIGAPFAWLFWWLIKKENLKVENFFTHLVIPIVIILDHLEKYNDEENIKNVENKLTNNLEN